MGKGKVVLGMSGGVDSSVAAFLLLRSGYEVVGLFMNCGVGDKKRWPTSIDWDSEEKDVRSICDSLGIELIVKDCGEGYEEKVISEMFRDYSVGLTPNPDILCNNVGKFPLLLRTMKEVGADFIATGHYVRVRHENGKAELLVGLDEKKDQSYFLVGLPEECISKCLFPIGELVKDEVRDIAKREGFSNWDKRGSKGICYLGKIDMKEFLRSRIKEKLGDLLNADREVIGSHPGFSFFTIGESVTSGKGIELNELGRKLYSDKKLLVALKDYGNRLIVAPVGSDILKVDSVIIRDLKLIESGESVVGKEFLVRIRHLGKFLKGKLEMKDGEWVFEFDSGVEGVAPGQFIVLYDGGRVVGGGEIR